MSQSWIEYDPLRLESAKNDPCVYCVKINGAVVYVGSTRRFRTRFYEHRIRCGYAKNIILPWGEVNHDAELSVKVSFSKKYGDWAMRELRLIKRLEPKFNIAHKNSKVCL
jgi:excinuclease UvrABC nuclease subunit